MFMLCCWIYGLVSFWWLIDCEQGSCSKSFSDIHFFVLSLYDLGENCKTAPHLEVNVAAMNLSIKNRRLRLAGRLFF